MSLVVYLLGFILFLSILSSGLIWGAVLAGVPSFYIVAVALVIFAIGMGFFKKSISTHDQNPTD